VLLSEKNYREVDSLLEPFSEIDALLLRRVIALENLADARCKAFKALLSDRMESLEASDARQHARELALYNLHVTRDFGRAVFFAKESFSYQKETIDFRNLIISAAAAEDIAAKDLVIAVTVLSRP